MGTSNTDSSAEVASETDSESASEIDLESEFDAGSDGNAESASDSDSDDESDSSSLADRLDTATTVVWAAFLGFVVVLALIPVVAVGLGAVPFAAPPVGPYFAFVGSVLVGTIAVIGVAILKG